MEEMNVEGTVAGPGISPVRNPTPECLEVKA